MDTTGARSFSSSDQLSASCAFISAALISMRTIVGASASSLNFALPSLKLFRSWHSWSDFGEQSELVLAILSCISSRKTSVSRVHWWRCPLSCHGPALSRQRK